LGWGVNLTFCWGIAAGLQGFARLGQIVYF